MAVFQNAVTGFNINIPRRGKSYHVQTEDSGINNPHIMTHLFLGGNIIATTKSSYADILGAPDLAEKVRALMDEQHKEMIRNLLDGKFDEQASKSVQLHAPKVEMLTPYQQPIQRADRAEDTQAAAQEAPAAPAKEMVRAEPQTDAGAQLSAANETSAAQEAPPIAAAPEKPPLSAHEQLRAALLAYLDAARYALGSIHSAG